MPYPWRTYPLRRAYQYRPPALIRRRQSLLYAGSTTQAVQGSSTFPALILEWSPTTNPADPPQWVDITSKLRRFSINRGRRNWLSQMSPGTATFDLDNTAGDFTPADSAATYYPNLIPGKRVRLRAVYGGVTYPRYVGFTTGYPTGWKNTDSQVTFNCVDGLGLLNLAQMNAVYAMAVLADAPSNYYRLLETSGTVASDSSGHGVAANYLGTVTFGQVDPITDGSDHAVLFDGTTGILIIPQRLGTAFSAEAWFTAPAPTGAGQVLMASDRNFFPQWSLFLLSDGSLDFTINYADSSFFGYSTTPGVSLANGTYHHVVITRDGANFFNLYVDGAVVGAGATAAAADFPNSNVYVGRQPGTTSTAVTIAELALYPTALSAVRVLAHYLARNAWLNDRSDVRVAHILDAVSWSNNDRNVQLGTSVLSSADDAGGKSALSAINDAATTENGLAFINQSGLLTFIGRNALQIAPYNVSQGTFGDNVAEIAYPMGDGKITLDDQDLWTRINVQRKGGALFTATASTAVVNQFYTIRQPGTVTSLSTSDGEAQQLANWLMNQSSIAAPRVDTLNMRGTAGNLANILPRELGDLVTYKGRPAGVGTVSQQARILGMKESGDLKERVYHTSWLLFAREPQAWLAGDAVYGVEGSTTIAGL